MIALVSGARLDRFLRPTGLVPGTAGTAGAADLPGAGGHPAGVGQGAPQQELDLGVGAARFVAGPAGQGVVHGRVHPEQDVLALLGAAAESIQDSMQGQFPPTAPLLVLAAYAVVLGYLARRYFRWE
jgi:hypothetical protein